MADTTVDPASAPAGVIGEGPLPPMAPQEGAGAGHMERVAFLMEETGERISCLLNPNTIVIKRTAGVRPRGVIGAGLTDEPLLYAGGGITELTLNLLFDLSLAGSTIVAQDVRDLTGPLWKLAENAAEPPIVRFVWGKSWNIPGLVTAVAERLEQFSPGGAPARSWLSLRLIRITEPKPETTEPEEGLAPLDTLGAEPPVLSDDLPSHEVIGEEEAAGERIDAIAEKYYGSASWWRSLAFLNDLDDPLRLDPGTALKLPPPEMLRGEE